MKFRRIALVLLVFAASSAWGQDLRSAASRSASPLESKGKAKAKVEIVLPKAEGGPGGSFGLGVILGEPSGLSAKLWFGEVSAADAGLAWSFVNQSLAFHGDYLFHARQVIRVGDEDIPPFVGIGGYLRINRADYVDPNGRDAVPDPVELGLRIPLGLCYRFAGVPLELSLEIAPCLELFPATIFKLQGGLAVRYYF